MMVNDKTESESIKSRNDKLEAGDPDIVWEIGCQLSPIFFFI